MDSLAPESVFPTVDAGIDVREGNIPATGCSHPFPGKGKCAGVCPFHEHATFNISFHCVEENPFSLEEEPGVLIG